MKEAYDVVCWEGASMSIKPLKLPARTDGSNAAANSRRSLVPIRYVD